YRIHLTGRDRADAYRGFWQETVDDLIEIGRSLMRSIGRSPVIGRIFHEADFLSLDVTVEDEGAGSCDFRPTRLELGGLEGFGGNDFYACRAVEKWRINAVEFEHQRYRIDGNGFGDMRYVA